MCVTRAFNIPSLVGTALALILKPGHSHACSCFLKEGRLLHFIPAMAGRWTFVSLLTWHAIYGVPYGVYYSRYFTTPAELYLPSPFLVEQAGSGVCM